MALAIRLLESLELMHAQGVVHRDLKPSNILIEADRVYLTDFGIAASVRSLRAIRR